MEKQKGTYYREVRDYYDQDSVSFKSRGEANPLLGRIREAFRKECEGIGFGSALEIGYGPGFDLIHFAETHPEAEVAGIDISPGMQEVAEASIREVGLSNARALVGTVEDIPDLFPGKQFDFIYVFFGALNTVEDLRRSAQILQEALKPGGKMVLTFVNKWYLLGILKPLIKLKFATAFRRLRKTWGGYSTSRFLPSKCYSPSEVRAAFSDFSETRFRGYSILFPAWYEFHKMKNPASLERKWHMDERLNHTFFKGLGEYTLFVFEKQG